MDPRYLQRVSMFRGFHAFALGAMTWQLAVCREASETRKCQMLYLAVFAARYLDIFQPGGYLYNFVFKIYYCVTTLALVTLLSAAHPIRAARRGPCFALRVEKGHVCDCFCRDSVACSRVRTHAAGERRRGFVGRRLVLLFRGSHVVVFDILEAFSLLPRYVMMYRLNRAPSRAVVAVVVMLGGYRVLCLVNWALKFSIPGAHFSRFHGVSAAGELLNLVFYADFGSAGDGKVCPRFHCQADGWVRERNNRRLALNYGF